MKENLILDLFTLFFRVAVPPGLFEFSYPPLLIQPEYIISKQ